VDRDRGAHCRVRLSPPDSSLVGSGEAAEGDLERLPEPEQKRDETETVTGRDPILEADLAKWLASRRPKRKPRERVTIEQEVMMFSLREGWVSTVWKVIEESSGEELHRAASWEEAEMWANDNGYEVES
jgi:hypothetical protein